MEKQFCQSCSMPLDSLELHGTEKDGSKSKEYCMYCYKDGAFVNPDMTLSQMKEFIKKIMKEKGIEQPLINMAVNTLPHLKRWGGLSAVL